MQSLSDGSGGRRPPDLETETAEGDGGLESDMDDGDETDYERLIDARFWDVLCGTTKDLPVMPTNTVRIFLSSTFSGECMELGFHLKIWNSRKHSTPLDFPRLKFKRHDVLNRWCPMGMAF